MTDANDTTILVWAQSLTRRYARGGRVVDALAPTTCAIRRSERIAVMGSSGSGKSTLLHMVAGLEAPTSGHIEWPALGPRDDLIPAKIAIAFQVPSLVVFLSVLENVALPLYLMGQAGDARTRAMTELARLGLTDLADKLPDDLSGGQAQRVALARAMASRPALLLADEPTGQLDQTTARATIAELIAFAEATHTAVVVATHDAIVAQSFDKVWRLDHGTLTTLDGKPQ
jgi:putative ABC transport system ATP-binding protein/lipoprotein-releasing system ATP-binding protein